MPKRKALKEDPELKHMTRFLLTGRSTELSDIIDEVRGRITGTRSWGGQPLTHRDDARDTLTDLLKWLEARNAHLTRVLNQ